MRRTSIPLALMVSLSLAGGCAIRDNPVESPATQQPDQISRIADNGRVTFIMLPKSQSLEKTVSATGLITVKRGGTIRLSRRVGTAFINMTLSFPPNAVEQDTYVTMSLDNDALRTTVEVAFGPSGMSFLKPGSLDVQAVGLDFSYLPPDIRWNDVKLLYYNSATGAWEEMAADFIMVNLRAGLLVCHDGSIPHFSIYAFGIIRK